MEHLDLQDQPVDVTELHRSTDCPIPLSLILPEIPADIDVLNLAVSSELGQLASNPVTPVTRTNAQMLQAPKQTTCLLTIFNKLA